MKFLITILFFICSLANAQTLISSKPLIKNIPPMFGEINSSLLLWGRHNQKYVRVGHLRYAILQKFPVHPRDVVVYKYDENTPGLGWVKAWDNGLRDAYQPPSLYVDGNNRLHIIYPDQSQGVVWGGVVHKVLVGAVSGNLTLQKNINTDIWGDRNAYFGTVYDNLTNRIYLCSNNWIGDRFRCAVFINDRWYSPSTVLQWPGHRYLYPNMYAWGHRFWLGVSANKTRVTQAEQDCVPSGSREISTMRRFRNYGQVEDYRITLGNSNNGAGMFENDLVFDGVNKIYLIGSSVLGYSDYWGSNGKCKSEKPIPNQQLYIYEHDLNGAFLAKRKVANAKGSQFNMVYQNGKIVIFGGGQYYSSTDQGKNWSSGDYVAPGYSKQNYSYGVTSTMKPKSGGQIDNNQVMLLQEVRHKTSKKSSVLALDFVL